MKNLKKLSISIFILISFVFSMSTVGAQMIDSDAIADQANNFNSGAEFGDASIGSVLATAIKAFLSFLGIIFIILIIYGGFRWMTARGNEQQVTEAKQSIQRAVIGLIIIIAAYAITFFVFEALNQVNNGGASGSPIL
ncbi:hypothetical protein K8R62_00750 [bacterium]|nr:hypothetical protein [bacterium]